MALEVMLVGREVGVREGVRKAGLTGTVVMALGASGEAKVSGACVLSRGRLPKTGDGRSRATVIT